MTSFFQNLFSTSEPAEQKLGLSLRGGAARGISYLGMFKVLEEEGVQIHSIIGSSAGAVVGGLYSLGFSIDEIKRLAKDTSITRLTSFRTFSSLKPLDGQNVISYLKEITKGAQFSDTNIKFAAQATDAETNTPVIFDEGSIAKALAASSALNFFMDPVEINSRKYVDGDYSAGYDVAFLKKNGATKVIGIDPGYLPDKSNPEYAVNHTMGRLIQTILRKDALNNPPDLIISNLAGNAGGPLSIKVEQLFQAGYDETKKHIGEIVKLTR